jgi:hypothetical protein
MISENWCTWVVEDHTLDSESTGTIFERLCISGFPAAWIQSSTEEINDGISVLM